jgi:DNA-binding beta-propeller fold protein YncE
MKRLLQILVCMVAVTAASKAQSVPGAPGWLNGWINTWSDLLNGPYTLSIAYLECHGNEMFYVVYRTYSDGRMIPDHATDAGYPCQCDKSDGSARPAGLRGLSLVQPQEQNCKSDNGMGQQVTVQGMQADGSTNGWGGPSSFGPTTGPAPDRFGPPGPPLAAQSLTKNAASQLSARAAAPGSTFTFTLPFRDLPSGPLASEVTSPPAWACNSSVNPTMFRVFHIDNVVQRLSMCPVALLASITVPDLPLQVRVTPDGSEAIVTSYSGAITFIDTATNKISASIQTTTDPNFAPDGIAISPDGSYALVTNYLAPPYSYLAVVDTASKQITSKIALDTDYPESVFINPDGTLAWVTYPWFNVAEVIDILTGTIVKTLRVTEAFSVVFNPTGTRAFVSSGAGSVQVIDTSTYATIQSVPADAGAMDLLISPDGGYVTVNNSLAQTVTLIDTRTLTSTTTNIGGTPEGAALVPSQ